MEICLLAIDLDGTLLNSAKQVSDLTVSSLRVAQTSAGVRIVLASARPPRSVTPFYTLLGLDTPMINYNGALVQYPGTGRIVLHRPMQAKIARTIAALAREVYPESAISGEVLDKWYTDRVENAWLTETARLCHPDVVAPLARWINQPMTKLLLLGEPNRLEQVHRAITERLPEQVALVQTEDHLLQVMHRAVSKAAGLRAAAAEMRIGRRQVMAIGDNANDAGMLRWAGIGVAMGNAAPEAIDAADYLTDHHDADGVATAVRKLILDGHAAKV